VVSTVVQLRTMSCCDMTLCQWAVGAQYFEAMYTKNSSWTFWPLKMIYFVLKCRGSFTHRYSVIRQKDWLLKYNINWSFKWSITPFEWWHNEGVQPITSFIYPKLSSSTYFRDIAYTNLYQWAWTFNTYIYLYKNVHTYMHIFHGFMSVLHRQ